MDIENSGRVNNVYSPKASSINTPTREALQNIQVSPQDLSKDTIKRSSSVTNNPLSNLMQTAKSNIEAAKYSNIPQPTMILEKNLHSIFMEHCYSRPHNWRSEANFLRPTKTLFVVQKVGIKRKNNNPLAPFQDCENFIDVETNPIESPATYDVGKATFLMSECERHAKFARVDESDTYWEDNISRINWTANQTRLFNNMVEILNAEHLARLSYKDVHNEPVIRRTLIDKTVKRFRLLLSTISWEVKLVQWLHHVITDNISVPYLSIYLDMLQTLKSKLPTFVDKIMYGPNQINRVGVTSNESLFPLLKRPWDPITSSVTHDKPKKLPGNPIIIIIPGTPSVGTSNTHHFKRLLKWTQLFTNLATVYTVFSNIGTSGHRTTIMSCLDQMFASTRAKIQEVKAEYPGRSIVLVGFNAGSALALQVAHVESVLCVLCLGFSLHTAEGRRGEPDDNLLDLQSPVLFVIGQCSNTSLQEEMEELRERMRIETGLIVVGGADDYLRVNKKKKRAEGITQNVVDRCIVDEVGEFVSGILLSPYPPQMRQSPTHVPGDSVKRSKTDRKRNNSNGSSMDSEPPSPTMRMQSRPGLNCSSPVLGRPPGSKMRNRWPSLNQGTPITSSPSCSPPIPHTTIDHSLLNDQNTVHEQPACPPTILPNKTLNIPHNKVTKGELTITPKTTPEKQSIVNTSQLPLLTANVQALAARGVISHSLVPGSAPGLRTIPPLTMTKPNIKVLDNISISSSNIHGKYLPNTPPRTLEMNKLPVNTLSSNSAKSGNTFSNVILMPDGKLKNYGMSVKGTGGTPIIFPMSTHKKNIITSQASTVASSTTIQRVRPKYITSKKQLIAPGRSPKQQPPQREQFHMPKPMPYIPSTSAGQLKTTSLPPPANLTSQDIMDLPIIFADDNQILRNTPDNSLTIKTTTTSTTNSNTTPQNFLHLPSKAQGKLVLVNKNVSTNNSTSPSIVKCTQSQMHHMKLNNTGSNIKYTKIILSKCPPTEENVLKAKQQLSSSAQHSLPTDLSVKKVDSDVDAVGSRSMNLPSASSNNANSSMDAFDLENELVATAVAKPTYAKLDPKMMTFIYKKPDTCTTINVPEDLVKQANLELERILEDQG